MRVPKMIALTLCVASTAGCAVAGPTAASTSSTAPAGELRTVEKPLSDLHKGIQTGWDATANAKVELTDQHAPEGQKALKVDLSPGPYPGFAYEFKSQDWSPYQAIRLTIFNSGKDFKLSYRVDDANSKNYATRFNSDIPFYLGKGENDLEVSIAALRQGNLFSRGIDVTRVRSIRFFVCDLKNDTASCVSRARLIAKEGGARTTAIADFAAGSPTRFGAHSGTTVAVEDSPSGAGRALKMAISGGQYPGVTLTGFNGDWLGYDLLAFDIAAAKGDQLPGSVSYKITDANGRKMTFSTSLSENEGKVAMPVEMAGQLSLGKIREISVFFEGAVGRTVYLSNLRLDRLDRVDYPSVHGTDAKEVGVKVDFTRLAALGKNSVFMNMLLVPLDGGKTRVVRCNSEVKGIVQYAVPADALDSCPKGSTIPVWGYLTEHGVWHYRQTTLKFMGQLPLTVTFDDAARFNH